MHVEKNEFEVLGVDVTQGMGWGGIDDWGGWVGVGGTWKEFRNIFENFLEIFRKFSRNF